MINIKDEETLYFENIKSQIHNFKNLKSKYFSKSTKNNEIKSHISSISFPKDKTSYTQLHIGPSLSIKLNQSNNIIRINMMQKYI